jgi:hypothetical protein
MPCQGSTITGLARRGPHICSLTSRDRLAMFCIASIKKVMYEDALRLAKATAEPIIIGHRVPFSAEQRVLQEFAAAIEYLGYQTNMRLPL